MVLLEDTPSGRLRLSSPEKPGAELHFNREDIRAAADAFAVLLAHGPPVGERAPSSPSSLRRATTTSLQPTPGAPAGANEGEKDVNGLLTIKHAAKLLALSDSMVRKLLRTGHLVAVRIGRSVRVRADDVRAMINATAGDT
jgi:excisionase family DNA binding protein